jgi:hypothetical protein
MKIAFQKHSIANVGKVLVDGVSIGEFVQHKSHNNAFASDYSINTPETGSIHKTGWADFKIAVRAAIAKARGEA